MIRAFRFSLFLSVSLAVLLPINVSVSSPVSYKRINMRSFTRGQFGDLKRFETAIWKGKGTHLGAMY